MVVLNQIANTINALMSVEQITQTIVEHCLKRVQASQGAVFLLEEREKQVDRFKTFVRQFSQTSTNIPFSLNESLTGWMIKHKTMLVSNDPESDERFRGINLAKMEIRSILAAPLLSRGGLLGTLVMFNKKDAGGFSENDKRFLGIVGTQTAKVIENAKLHEQEKQLISIREEIKVAQLIQRGFLPKTGLSLQSCEICGVNVPAKEVGGDFYDMVKLDEDRVFLSLGDVSGKGIPAALLMANAQAVLRSQLFRTGESRLIDLADSLNLLIHQFSGPEQFITTVFGLFECHSKIFRYINAGHPPPLIVKKDGQIIRLTDADLVIGIMPGYKFTPLETSLEAGDILCLYSDGIIEAFGAAGEEFGEERMAKVLVEHRADEIPVICTKMIEDISSFRKNVTQSDDITMVILRVR